MTILSGFLSGIVSGMGIGGGTILILCLTLFLRFNQHMAQCTNLYYFVPTAISALVVHIKNKNIDFKVSWKIIIFGVLGSFIGSYIAIKMSTVILRKIFAVFLFIMGISQLINHKGEKNEKS
ncbi:MAG: sulfite exporter TauE/SafE family protein [Ruminococcaceae bacterium]|nr:sulfite exporter TauE/SafE family protein [Oscillospiraceae bacterium]